MVHVSSMVQASSSLIFYEQGYSKLNKAHNNMKILAISIKKVV